MLKPIIGKIHPRFNRQYYREFFALKNINFELKKGESLGIIGRNGAGKSTLLQIISGTLSPTSGDVKVAGRINALLELGSGFNPDFTGRENVFLNGAILGFTHKEIESRFEEILDFSEIGDFIDQPVKTYSSGMFVRLAFSVQALMEPEILIIDEALSVGDVFFQSKCHTIIDKLLSNGNTTFIFVSHDIHSVIKYCKKAIFLNKGTIIYSGDSKIAASLFFKMDKFSESELIEEGKKIDEINLNVGLPKDQSKLVLDKDYTPVNTLKFSNGNFDRVQLLAYKTTSLNPDSELFYIGSKFKFSFIFKAKDKLAVPLVALFINTKSNIPLYGKFNFQIDRSSIPGYIEKESTFEIEFIVDLNLLLGEYIFGIIFNEMSGDDYDLLDSFSTSKYSESIVSLFAAQIGSFTLSVAPKSLFLPFNGLVDLPTEINFQVLERWSVDWANQFERFHIGLNFTN